MDARATLLLGLTMGLLGPAGCDVEPVHWQNTDAGPDSSPAGTGGAVPPPATGGQVAPPPPTLGGRVGTGGQGMGGASGFGGSNRPRDASPEAPGSSPDVTSPDLGTLTPKDAGYVNDAGWHAGSPCCLPCGDYPGCLLLVQTTPMCTPKVGDPTCLEGGTGPGSVWPQCLPVKLSGGCR